MSSDGRPSASSENSQVPPPSDPFQTYQTPYPRHPTPYDDQNPFVAFRKFADSQLSAVLSGLSSVFAPVRSADPRVCERSQQDHRDNIFKQLDEQLVAQAANLDEHFRRLMQQKQEEAEGYWKRFEQDWEERRVQNEQTMRDAQEQWTKAIPDADTQSAARPANAGSELDLYEKSDGWLSSDPNNTGCPLPHSRFPLWSTAHLHGGRPPVSDSDLGQQVNEFISPILQSVDALSWWTGSTYSPMRLSRSADVRISQKLDWEAAFEDLISGEHVYGESEQSAHQQAHDMSWINSLVQTRKAATAVDDLIRDPKEFLKNNGRNVLPDWVLDLEQSLSKEWEAVWNSDKLSARSDIPNHYPGSTSTAGSALQSWPISSNETADTPVSTLTTTHTQRSHDGSVTTTRVVNTRFADGREEQHEMTEVSPAEPAQRVLQVPEPSELSVKDSQKQDTSITSKAVQAEARRAGKGWFWN